MTKRDGLSQDFPKTVFLYTIWKSKNNYSTLTDPHHGISKQPCWHHPCCVSVGWGLLDFMSASSPLPPPPSSSSSSASLSPPLLRPSAPGLCANSSMTAKLTPHNSQWPCEEPRPAVSILTFFLAFCLKFFLPYFLTFFLTSWHYFKHISWHSVWHSLWHIFWHSFWQISDILSDICSDIFSDILSDIFSDILSDIFSHILFDILSVGWGLAGNTGRRWSPLRSGREHWTWLLVVEARGWREEEDEEDEEEQAEEEAEEDEEDGEEQAEEEAEEEQADIKSNNPHLTGGKRPKTPLIKAKMIAVWLNEATPKPKYVQQWPTHCICKNVKKMALSPQRVRLLTPGHPSEAGLESNWWPLSQANARGHWIGAFSERKCLSSSSWS